MTTTQQEWATFLTALATYGQVRAACVAADISTVTAYRRRNTDPEFATAWDRAKDTFGGTIRQRVVEKAREDPKVLLALDRLANKEDYETTRNVNITGQFTFHSVITPPPTLGELQELAPDALEAVYRAIDGGEDDE